MAAKTITVDTNEWAYPDASGITHTVTNGQTLALTMTDGGAAAVIYSVDVAQTLTTTDGYTIYFRPHGPIAGNAIHIGSLADANDNATTHYNAGELEVEDPTSGIIQIWTIDTLKIDALDAPTELSMACTDQFGNKFSVSTLTVA